MSFVTINTIQFKLNSPKLIAGTRHNRIQMLLSGITAGIDARATWITESRIFKSSSSRKKTTYIEVKMEFNKKRVILAFPLKSTSQEDFNVIKLSNDSLILVDDTTTDLNSITPRKLYR